MIAIAKRLLGHLKMPYELRYLGLFPRIPERHSVVL
jgi:hypothetical protein